MFPGGWPGLGLLALRAAVGGATIVQGLDRIADPGDSGLVAWAAGLLAAVSGAAVLAGFLTPLACVLAGLVSAAFALGWLPPPSTNLFNTSPSIVFLLVIAAALILLGPGGFSADARLFGRREIIIPKDSRY
jgi:uncharacterized membrane protein YphA (DoxX/SURF4 family)